MSYIATGNKSMDVIMNIIKRRRTGTDPFNTPRKVFWGDTNETIYYKHLLFHNDQVFFISLSCDTGSTNAFCMPKKTQ